MHVRTLLHLLIVLLLSHGYCKGSPKSMQPVDILLSQLSDNLKSREDIAIFLKSINPNVLTHRSEVGLSCSRALQKLSDEFAAQALDAMQMVDSWGSYESGILKGSFVFPGRYYDCKEVNNDFYKGKHCNINLKVNTSKTALIAISDRMNLVVGGCFPDVCTTSEITSLFGAVPKNITFNVKCPEDLHEYWIYYKILIVVTSILTALVFFASMYDSLTSHRVNHEGQRHEIILAFSLQRNTNSLMTTQQNRNDIGCINGIRVLSMLWVVFGHAFLIPIKFADNALTMIDTLTNSWILQIILNGTFAVDSFFFVSGLLVCYQGLQVTKQNGKSLSFFKMLLYRYIRLTPSLTALILIALAGPVLQDGPFWQEKSIFVSNQCRKFWWSNIIFINNVYPSHMPDQCVDWTWYLANDMQFFIVCMMLLRSVNRSTGRGIALITSLLLASISVTFTISIMTSQMPQVLFRVVKIKNNQLFTEMTDRTENPIQTDTYTKPWCRISTYLVGVLTGLLLHRRETLKFNKFRAAMGWIFCLFGIYVSIFSLKPWIENAQPIGLLYSAIYNALSRPLFGASLAWLTIACVKGYAGGINTILSLPALRPLAKLSYAIYLLHCLVIWALLATRETRIHYSIRTIFMLFISSCLLSLLVAYIFVMLVEAPALKLAKILFTKTKNEKVT